MLKHTTDRLDYTGLLTPPAGYDTEYAIGATYSLDMDALTGVCLALGLSESVDGELFGSPICLLNALMRTSERLALFCQGGQIKAPPDAGPLHALLDRVVFEVNLRNKKSFHPKLWFTRYGNGEEDRWRLVVLSRNLTFDRSWDIAFYLDGTWSDTVQERNTPLRDFLHFLLGHLPRKDANAATKRDLVRDAIQDVMNVEFKLEHTNFSSFSFCPTGIPSDSGVHSMEGTGLFEKYNALFILSPFLSNPGGNPLSNPIDRLAAAGRATCDRTLITRRSELGKLSPEALAAFRIHVMREDVVNGEEALSEGGESRGAMQQDLHAKLYLRTSYSDSELYVGSQNASISAFTGGNVEFMLKLSAKRRYLNVDILKRDLFGESDRDNPFEQIQPSDIQSYEPPKGPDLERLLREICRCGASAHVEPVSETYRIRVSFDSLPRITNGELSPLLSERSEPLQPNMEFIGLPLNRLCEFYRLTVRAGEESLTRVMRIRTDGIPDERDGSILNGVLKDKQGFLSYVSLLLGESYYIALMESRKLAGAGYLFSKGEPIPALYEKMLKTAATNPGKLGDVGRLLGMIQDKEMIPEGFEALYETFRKAVAER